MQGLLCNGLVSVHSVRPSVPLMTAALQHKNSVAGARAQLADSVTVVIRDLRMFEVP